MRFHTILAFGLSVVMLSACANPIANNEMPWTKISNALPRGYAGQNKHNLLKPSRVPEGWNYLDTYDEAPAVVLVDQAPGENDGVLVNPDTVPEYTNVEAVDSTGLDMTNIDVAMDEYGQMVHQFFFDHGSARISKGDRVAVDALVANFKAGGVKNPSLLLIGHASARVDGVMEPMRRRMINMEMAKKRAVAIATAFKKAGVAPTWIETISRGDEGAVEGASAAQEAKERRVDIFVKESAPGAEGK
jgi:outer membrane protein OmpA-like peptidoglycan-associated protein